MCVARGLLFEGNVLAYDLTSNEAKWVPVRGMAEDLSRAEEASTRELSYMVPLDSAKEAQRLDRFRELRSESGGESGMEECPAETPHEEHMDQGYEGDSDEERSDSTPDDLCSPASSLGCVHHHTIISRVAAQMASAGQTSAHLRRKVALCLEAKNMPSA